MRYGDDALWDELPENTQPFFQFAQTRGEDLQAPIDWTAEREWRHVGDVDLSQLPADAALVFVPTHDEADKVAQISRWPIVVLSQE